MTNRFFADLDSLLIDCFPMPEYRQVALRILKKHGGDTLLVEIMSDLDAQKVELQQNLELLKILSAKIILKINDRVGAILEFEEKMLFKQIFKTIHEDVFEKHILPGLNEEQLDSLQDSLKAFCRVQNYNYEDLLSHFNIELFKKIKKSESSNSTTSQVKVSRISQKSAQKYFQCNSEELIKELSIRLKDREWIKKRKELERLFNPESFSKRVVFNQEFRDEILLFFDSLTKEKFIQCKGTRGHFEILLQDAVDFHGQVFMEKSKIKKHMSRLRSSPERLKKINKQIERIISLLKSSMNFEGTLPKVPL